jgi:hypothetical protein
VATSALLELTGAVAPPATGELAEPGAEPGVPWHWGDPSGEQRAAERSAIVVDRSTRDVLLVRGPDRLSWLHSLTSQHLTDLTDGASTEALVLDPQGRVEQHAVLTDLAATTYLDTEPGHGPALLDHLRRMVFWSKVEPAATDLAVLTILGPATVDVLAAAGVTAVRSDAGAVALPAEDRPAGQAPGQPADLPGGLVRRLPWRLPDGSLRDAADLLIPRALLPVWWQRLLAAGATAAGSWAHEALRVAALRPRVGRDTDARTIPQEAGWIGRAVHLDKGCYRGQETVARVQNLGRPPRRMLLLHLDGSAGELPVTGDEVRTTEGGKVVGRVGTVARHHELGPIALALVKRAVPAEAGLLAGDPEHGRQVAAAIDPESVPPDTGEPPGRAAVRRLQQSRV